MANNAPELLLGALAVVLHGQVARFPKLPLAENIAVGR